MAVKRTAPLQVGFLCVHGYDPVETYYTNIWSGSAVYFTIRTTTGLFEFTPKPTLPLLETWYRLCFVYNGTVMQIYIDGVDKGTFPATGTIIAAPTRPLIIGNYFGYSLAHRGIIDDFRIYNTALTPAQMKRHTERSAYQ